MVNHMCARISVCPNPECNEKIEEPLLLKTPTEHFYVCPHCFIELNAHVGVQEGYTDTTAKEHPEDSVFGRTVKVKPPKALDTLAPNRRFRHP